MMTYLSKIQEVKNRADIVQVALKMNIQLNRNMKAKCPFHKEKTASFSISKSKQIFHCFGCGVGGDCITLVSRLLNVNAYEAAKNINEMFYLGVDFGQKISSIEIEKYQYQQKIKKEYEEWLNKAHGTLCSYYRYLVDTDNLEEKYQNIDMICYFIDVLNDGSETDLRKFYKNERKLVKRLGERGFS